MSGATKRDMTSVENMIIKNKIELKPEEKLKYYKVSIILLVVAAFCLFNGLYDLEDYTVNQLTNNSNKTEIILIRIRTN